MILKCKWVGVMFYWQLRLWMSQAQKNVINCTVFARSEEGSVISFGCFYQIAADFGKFG